MESFHLPVTAVVTLGICMSALAFTISDPAVWFQSRPVIEGPEPALTTQCDRLVMRYLLSESPSFEKLAADAEKFVGNRSYDMLLRSVDQAFDYDSMFTRDKIYFLRGKILMRLGRDKEAAENFRSALRWNVGAAEARKNLINYYIDVRSYDLAEVEIKKALKHEPDEEEIKLYQSLLEEIKSFSHDRRTPPALVSIN